MAGGGIQAETGIEAGRAIPGETTKELVAVGGGEVAPRVAGRLALAQGGEEPCRVVFCTEKKVLTKSLVRAHRPFGGPGGESLKSCAYFVPNEVRVTR